MKLVKISKKCISRGIDALMKGYDLAMILKKDRKTVLPPSVNGISLIESIITCLWEDCDISTRKCFISSLLKLVATQNILNT